MENLRRIVSPFIAVIASGGLFYYLSETIMPWRIAFAAIMFLATYIIIDGFLRSR